MIVHGDLRSEPPGLNVNLDNNMARESATILDLIGYNEPIVYGQAHTILVWCLVPRY